MGKQLSIYLDENEAKWLTEISIRECRRPTDQAKFIIRSFLYGSKDLSQESGKLAIADSLATRSNNEFVNANP